MNVEGGVFVLDFGDIGQLSHVIGFKVHAEIQLKLGEVRVLGLLHLDEEIVIRAEILVIIGIFFFLEVVCGMI